MEWLGVQKETEMPRMKRSRCNISEWYEQEKNENYVPYMKPAMESGLGERKKPGILNTWDSGMAVRYMWKDTNLIWNDLGNTKMCDVDRGKKRFDEYGTWWQNALAK